MEQDSGNNDDWRTERHVSCIDFAWLGLCVLCGFAAGRFFWLRYGLLAGVLIGIATPFIAFYALIAIGRFFGWLEERKTRVRGG